MNSIKKALYCAFFVYVQDVRYAAATWMSESGDARPMSVECTLPSAAEQATLKYVIDGDSLQLTHAQQIRLLAINSPELHSSTSQLPAPYALAAKHQLQQLLPTNQPIIFRRDREKHDRYQRTLAQVFTADGVDVATVLLKQGYAEVLIVPPNRALADCYTALEQQARAQKKGLWSQTDLWQNTASLRPLKDEKERQFVHIYGRVEISKNAAGVEQFSLDQRVRLHIEAVALINMIKTLQHRTIFVRGYLRWKNQQAHLSLQHNTQIMP